MQPVPRQGQDGRQAAVEQHMGLVHKIAHQLWESIQRALPLEDLVGYGTVGLLEAFDRFRHERNVEFSTYAYYRVRGAILDGIRRMSGVPPAVYRRARALQKMADYLEHTLSGPVGRGRAATLGRTLAQVLSDMEVVYLCSLPEALPDPEPDPADVKADRHRLRARLHAVLRQLNEEQRQVVVWVYFRDGNLADFARARGRSRSWACRLHQRAIRRLHQLLTADPGPARTGTERIRPATNPDGLR